MQRVLDGDDLKALLLRGKRQTTLISMLPLRNTLKILNNRISIRADRETFARLIFIQQQRGVSLRDVLQYELGPLPLSIGNYDDALHKTQKSKLFKHIHPDIPLCDAAPENSPTIFDGMVLLQTLPPN